jgi:FkbM family methyltransferase
MASGRSTNPYGWLLKIRPAPLAVALKMILRVRRVCLATQTGEFWVDPASVLGDSLITQGEYEPELGLSMRRLLGEGRTFVDVGANEGYFSVMGSKLVGTAGRVLAIEPQPRLFDVLHANLRMNMCNNVVVAANAVADRNGFVELNLAPSTNNGSSGVFRKTRYPGRKQRVPAFTLDSLFETHGLDACDFLKMDIEGFELEALQGADRLLREKRIRAMNVDDHPSILASRGLALDCVSAMLFEYGYRREVGADIALYLA